MEVKKDSAVANAGYLCGRGLSLLTLTEHCEAA